MSIASAQEYELTRTKLESVRRSLAKVESRHGNSAAAASHRSLRAYANQLIEELRRYESSNGLDPTKVAEFEATLARR